MMPKILKVFFLFTILILGSTHIYAQEYDFSISNNTIIQYTTGEEFVTVKTEYLREVNNGEYFFSTTGEKIFHIPDLPKSKEYELELERQLKKESLKVTDSNQKTLTFTIEDLKNGEGMYIKVPNYKQTTKSSPYRIFVEYQTHDLVKKVFDNVVIVAPALHKDTQFLQTDEKNGTKTSLTYNLKIIVDKDIPKLTKIYPERYNIEDSKNSTIYLFSSQDRIGNAPYLEFATEQNYKFELRYKTPKTDTLTPEKYSSSLNILSTNIYELSLPREFSETNQRVKIEKISPTPTRISKDSEGNILAKFEVPANRSSEILVTGYIQVQQNSLENRKYIPNISMKEYLTQISKDTNLQKYLIGTKYWESDDVYIKEEAKKLFTQDSTLSELIKNDYKYINGRLEYDENKVNTSNERIGAKAALTGGGSVCMEYADSMIAILRSQGIPARAALGYSNLNTLAKTNKLGSTRHQWVQVWIPNYGWMSIDPTYESENMLIGQSIEKILWETFYDEELSNIKIYSANKIESDNFSDYSVKIYAIPNIPTDAILFDYSEIQVDTGNTKDTINTFVKTTTIGKSIIIVTPILVIIFLLILLLSLVKYLIRRKKNHISS